MSQSSTETNKNQLSQTPGIPVVFDGESDGEAIYSKHAAALPAFMK
ncbi:hypothetical protein [Domibacillus aminovorans]|nr:hypothetical protein [Domibacillus aminovorans]